MLKATIVMLAAMCCLPVASQAYESDVHFGLTKWLALQAGFTQQQADTIALGNQRSDSGIMDSIELTLEYACLGHHVDGAEIAATYHFASTARPPAPAERRIVAAGSPAAHRLVDQVMATTTPSKAGFMLLKLGEALHVLQDSWAYQGTPDTPDFPDQGVQCSPELAWTAPAVRGGWRTHGADITRNWPADIRAMAAATYAVLTRYAPISGTPRQAAGADQVLQQLDAFINAGTKAAKRAWFRQHAIEDTSFLDTVSLPDGTTTQGKLWQVRRLVPLPSAHTRQYRVPRDAIDFYDGFFAAWLQAARPESAIVTGIRSESDRELAARLKLWRLRDHGSVTELAHIPGPYSKKQRQAIERLAAARGAYIQYDQLQEAFFPLLEQGPVVSPLLPYVIHVLPGSHGKRIIAVTKLRHVPYDELGIIAEKNGDAWRPVSLISIVSH